MTTEDKTQEEQLGRELETVMERACNSLAKGMYADLDNKTVNWPLLFSEVLGYIEADRKAQAGKLLDAIEAETYKGRLTTEILKELREEL